MLVAHRGTQSRQFFVATILDGNFILLPLLVGLLTAWLPLDPVVRLGALMVLRVPCTD